ncbi:MAG: tetratricopeptide (TPR) repeat protein [Pseudohongiellaceae bacterium]|jgi:tetratricopeptide (TPR) repeat protein
MKRTKARSRIASLLIAGALSITAASSALAEYRLTAFGNTIGYRSLISADVESIESTFGRISLSGLDHFEANNLCVAHILLKDFNQAISTCNAAIEKTKKAYSTSPMAINSATASIYSNMAIAKAMSGDKISAIQDLELALSFNRQDKNVNTNYNQLSSIANLTAALP